ncbi:hypothetical protein DMENIID0001_063900 [Sergentomyia squamirostris]
MVRDDVGCHKRSVHSCFCEDDGSEKMLMKLAIVGWEVPSDCRYLASECVTIPCALVELADVEKEEMVEDV